LGLNERGQVEGERGAFGFLLSKEPGPLSLLAADFGRSAFQLGAERLAGRRWCWWRLGRGLDLADG
jgi:hypothetical protein